MQKKSESLLILRHLPQKISKPHFFATEAPEENPLPGKTSLAWHISLTESVAATCIHPLESTVNFGNFHQGLIFERKYVVQEISLKKDIRRSDKRHI